MGANRCMLNRKLLKVLNGWVSLVCDGRLKKAEIKLEIFNSKLG